GAGAAGTVTDPKFGTADVDVTYEVARTALQADNDKVPADKNKMTLGTLLGQCVLNADKQPAALREPVATSIQVNPQRLPDTREAAAQVLADAGRDHL